MTDRTVRVPVSAPGVTKESARSQHKMSRMMVVAILMIVVLAFASALRFFGSGKHAVDVSVPMVTALELLPDDVSKVQVRELQRSLPLTGTITPLNQIEIKSQLAGQIEEVVVREGETVRRNQVVVRLDETDIVARLQDKLAALAVGKAQLGLARRTLEMNAALLKQNFISQTAFDNIRNTYQVSESTLVSLTAQVTQARKAVTDAVIRSPMDGVVAERLAEPGLSVAANTALLTVQDLSVMDFEVLVPASDIALVRIGQAARLQVEGFKDRVFVGQVERINPSTEKGTRSIVVHLRVDNRDGQLKGGMFVQGTLGISEVVMATVVPSSAIREASGKTTVFVIDNGLLTEKTVQPGLRDAANDIVQIDGLVAGTLVVVGSLGRLTDGQPVHVKPAFVAARPQP